MKSRRFVITSSAVLALVVAAAVGCGEKRVPVFPVSGKITFQGEPPVGAQVVLHPAAGSGHADVAPTGVVKSDGAFAIDTYAKGDGAPQGEYVATVQWFKVVTEGEGGGGRGPNVLPKKYESASTSPIKVSVSGPTEIPPIEITP